MGVSGCGNTKATSSSRGDVGMECVGDTQIRRSSRSHEVYVHLPRAPRLGVKGQSVNPIDSEMGQDEGTYHCHLIRGKKRYIQNQHFLSHLKTDLGEVLRIDSLRTLSSVSLRKSECWKDTRLHTQWHLMLDRPLGHTLLGACEYADMTVWVKFNCKIKPSFCLVRSHFELC